MAETIENGKWHWFSVMKDLEEQGHYKGVKINPHGSGGITSNGTVFYITWVYNTFFLLSMSKEDSDLVSAFSTVIEYKPFCKYKRENYIVYEWDKNEPEKRLLVLRLEEFDHPKNLTQLEDLANYY